MRRLLPILLLMLLAMPVSASASKSQEAMLQDDDKFIYTTIAKRKKALDEAKALGVDRIRVTILWRAIAPKPKSRKKPKGFDAADPGAYPPGIWTNYDLLANEAARRGIKLNFNITGPSPTWANDKPPRSDIADNYEPDPKEFKKFVMAVGKRYSGQSVDGPYGYDLPRVDYFSIWNEPNHSGWLTPTWEKRKGKFVERSASLYRELLDAAWEGLRATGHGKDTILIGETAPAGNDSKDVKRFMKPLTFIRALYCVDEKLKRFKGKNAKRLELPEEQGRVPQPEPGALQGVRLRAPSVPAAERARPSSPRTRASSRSRCSTGSSGCSTSRCAAMGVRASCPIYLTEFGYQTRPDPAGVSFGKQAAYINEAEYIAARDARVRSTSQFLLVDGGPPDRPHLPERPEVAQGQAQAGLRRLPAARLGDAQGQGLGPRPARATRPARQGEGPVPQEGQEVEDGARRSRPRASATSSRPASRCARASCASRRSASSRAPPVLISAPRARSGSEWAPIDAVAGADRRLRSRPPARAAGARAGGRRGRTRAGARTRP